MLLSAILGALAALSLVLTLWQWGAARRFPLHQRLGQSGFAPGVTLLKPLKGCDPETELCLRSWFAQAYPGPIQILLAVASDQDPVCPIVRQLIKDFPERDAQLLVCGPLLGANLKVSKLMQLEGLAKHEVLTVSDADVRVPSDFLANALAPLADPKTGLVNCFYRLANPSTAAMQWEAIAINADFWSQVLQSQSLKPLDFALGAVMITRRQQLQAIGGFAALADCLADDYQLGHRIARAGYHIALAPVVVECWSEPMGWAAVWKHQLRWARTIRVCQPAPYFFSILSNGSLWPLLWLVGHPSAAVLAGCVFCLVVRVAGAWDLQARLTRAPVSLATLWLTPLKDVLQTLIWMLAFLGNRIEWRGELMQLRRDGTLVRIKTPAQLAR